MLKILALLIFAFSVVYAVPKKDADFCDRVKAAVGNRDLEKIELASLLPKTETSAGMFFIKNHLEELEKLKIIDNLAYTGLNENILIVSLGRNDRMRVSAVIHAMRLIKQASEVNSEGSASPRALRAQFILNRFLELTKKENSNITVQLLAMEIRRASQDWNKDDRYQNLQNKKVDSTKWKNAVPQISRGVEGMEILYKDLTRFEKAGLFAAENIFSKDALSCVVKLGEMGRAPDGDTVAFREVAWILQFIKISRSKDSRPEYKAYAQEYLDHLFDHVYKQVEKGAIDTYSVRRSTQTLLAQLKRFYEISGK